MEQIKKIIKKNYFLILILIATSFFHLLWLDRVPSGMSHDEVVYSLSSLTFHEQATDITGTGFPMGLFRTETEGNISIFPTILLSPIHLFFPLSQMSARLPYVLFIYISAVAVFFISTRLFKNERVGLLALLLFLLEPWSFFLARFAAEPPVALMFYLWAIATLFIFNGKKLFITFILFVLAFFSYHGGKILFLPLIVVCLLFFLSIKRINYKESIYFFLGSFIIFISFFAISLSLPGGIVESRKGEIFFLNTEFLTDAVDAKRKTIVENPLTSVFVNKATVASDVFFHKYITAFSPKVLFLEGDTRLTYSFLYHGLLYVFDAFFILVGLIAVFIKQKKTGVFLVGLILISPLPSGVNGVMDSYINRSSFLLPVLVMLSAFGLYNVFLFLCKKIKRVFVGAFLTVVMGFAISNFLFFYFFQYPLTSADSFVLGEKIAAEFINRSRTESNRRIVAVQNEPGELYLETIFFSQDKDDIGAFIGNIDNFRENRYELSGTVFIGDCPRSYDKNTIYIIDDIKQCSAPFTKSLSIRSPYDAGVIYKIYNSDLCSNHQTVSWQRFHYVSDFDTRSMDTKTFCERWISGESR
jgi:hypothetical protein